MNAYVFIETRKIDGMNAKFNSFKKHLPGWKAVLLCSPINSFEFSMYDDRQFVGLYSIAQYNELLTSAHFWDSLKGYHRVLICQHDSGLLRIGIDEFLDYDYVGAPWTFQAFGGNGGLSLRNPKVMYDICRRYQYNPANGNEDIYFSNIMHHNGFKLAPRDVCRKFSVENEFTFGSLGYHFGRDCTLTEDQKQLILEQYGRG